MGESSNTTRIAASRMRPWQNAGAPLSGTSGTLAQIAEAGALLWDTSNGVVFVNEGTQVSPYWTPVTLDQLALFGVQEDFRAQLGHLEAATTTETILAGGLRIFGQGLDEIDSGLVPQTPALGGVLAQMLTSVTAAHLVAIGMSADMMQPDQHQLLVVDAEIAHVTAITARAVFCGFVGIAPDALDPAVTGATTVATLVQNDLAGLWFDSGLTDADRLFGVHNKNDEAATQDLTVDGDTGVDVPAAGTSQRLRVEISAAGVMTAFLDKVQVYTFATALAPAVAVSPVLYLETNASAIKVANVSRFGAWAYR